MCSASPLKAPCSAMDSLFTRCSEKGECKQRLAPWLAKVRGRTTEPTLLNTDL